jgi:hypothetical protein
LQKWQLPHHPIITKAFGSIFSPSTKCFCSMPIGKQGFEQPPNTREMDQHLPSTQLPSCNKCKHLVGQRLTQPLYCNYLPSCLGQPTRSTQDYNDLPLSPRGHVQGAHPPTRGTRLDLVLPIKNFHRAPPHCPQILTGANW